MKKKLDEMTEEKIEESIPLFKINKHISLIELFGGIGSQAKALERLQEKGFLPHGFSHYKLVEYDKYPVASYNAIHNTTFSPLDITKIHANGLGIRERERECYLMTYSFPCQDISASGKQKGVVLNDLRIRKLTSKECWRLMGFDDSDWEKASKVNSNTQLYKQAGNAIVVNVLEAIFKQML